MKSKAAKTKPGVSPLGAGLLILGSLVLPFAFADERFSVEIDAGLVTLEVEDVVTADLLAAIAAEADLLLVQHAALDGMITASFDAEPLPAVLDAILRGGSYQLLQRTWTESAATSGPARSGTLWVFSSGNSAAPRSTVGLEAALGEGSFEDRKAAIRALGKAGDASAVQSLSLALHDPDANVRDAALEVLSRIGSDESLAAIASLAADGDPWIRIEAANAMSLADSRSALNYLALALHDPDPQVRMAVIEAFTDIPDPASVAAIRRAMSDPDPEVREYAADALEDVDATIAFDALRRQRGAQ